MCMFRSFKSFVCNLSNQKTVGILSIGSLAIALAVVLVIGIWAINEFSFDRFQKDIDKTYRLCQAGKVGGESMDVGMMYAPVGGLAKNRCPEIESMCRVISLFSPAVKTEKEEYSGTGLIRADTNFFTFFTFPLKMGDAFHCLDAPNKVVIDETAAALYFPGENPMGKNLMIGGGDLTVSGVMYDMPRNSHLKARLVMHLGHEAEREMGGSQPFLTYFKIPDPQMLAGVERKVTDVLYEAMPLLKSLDFAYYLESLKDTHFSDNLRFEPIVKGNKSLVIALLLTTFMILLIACINFINLFISTSFLRLRSIGVKKTHGASRWLLVKEFYAETFYYVLAAVVLGIGMALLALPMFNEVAGSDISIDVSNPVLCLFLVALVGLVILLTGTFPALYMTKFNAVSTLKGTVKGGNVSFLQKSLIVTQFTASIIILIFVFFIHRQVDFMISKDLGFDKGNVLYVNGGGIIGNYESFRAELMRNPAIADITVALGLPTVWTQGGLVKKEGEDLIMEYCRVKPNYFNLLGMDMVEGEAFRDDGNEDVCVLNETAVKMLGFANPIGERITKGERDMIVTGIVKDAQTKSLHQKVDPQVYLKHSGYSGFILFKVQGDFKKVIGEIEKKWSEENPGAPFKYSFLDEEYEKLYGAEMKISQILTIAMGIMFSISIAGLFAMAYYATQRRLKEVGVRKVNGATMGELLLILNRDFFLWVGIAFSIACPAAYWLVVRWLETFVDRTPMSLWVFLLAGVIIFIVTLATVSYQTWRAASVNPVKVLKSE